MVQRHLHLFPLVDKIGRQVTPVELHALDHFQLILERLTLLHRDDAIATDFLHGLGQDVADIGAPVCGDGGHLADRLVVLAGFGQLVQLSGCRGDGGVNAPLEIHGIVARGNRLVALADHRLGEHRGGGSAITRHVGGF